MCEPTCPLVAPRRNAVGVPLPGPKRRVVVRRVGTPLRQCSPPSSCPLTPQFSGRALLHVVWHFVHHGPLQRFVRRPTHETTAETAPHKATPVRRWPPRTARSRGSVESPRPASPRQRECRVRR